ncbi:MAG: phosphohistidine phosphatase SixA [Acidobacteriaceae bacterium]|nr:phosphohistidine phosphatase SixA [Acidobacteriaceae bacterium]
MAASHELYLIRHAIAETRGDQWPDETKRPLTDEGKASMRQAAHGLVCLGVTFDIVLASPYVRARQTAEIVANACADRPAIVTVDSLTPDGTVQGVLRDLAAHTAATRMALVGHAPFIGELAAQLTGLRRPLEFKKGAVCRIDITTISPAGLGVLRWFISPKLLRAAGRR